MATSEQSSDFVLPDGLLKADPQTKKKYFDEIVAIAHREIDIVCSDVMAHALDPAESPIIMVAGPSGVGKTALYNAIYRRLIKMMIPEMEKDPGYIPIIKFEEIAPHPGPFKYRMHNKQVLAELLEPPALTLRKKIYPLPSIDATPVLGYPKPRVSEDWEFYAEYALALRKTKFILVDEAEHMTKGASGTRLQDVLDKLKSFANRTKIVHILFGSYQLLDFSSLSPQLNRRTGLYHFMRYRIARKEQYIESEVEEFKNVIASLEKRLPLAEPSNLEQYWELIFKGSIGCTGLVKQTFARCLARALREGKHKITKKILDQSLEPPRKVKSYLVEALKWEQLLSAEEDARIDAELSRLLGLPNSSPNPAGPSKKNQKVGEPNPTRYEVGNASKAS